MTEPEINPAMAVLMAQEFHRTHPGEPLPQHIGDQLDKYMEQAPKYVPGERYKIPEFTTVNMPIIRELQNTWWNRLKCFFGKHVWAWDLSTVSWDGIESDCMRCGKRKKKH